MADGVYHPHNDAVGDKGIVEKRKDDMPVKKRPDSPYSPATGAIKACSMSEGAFIKMSKFNVIWVNQPENSPAKSYKQTK